MARPSYKPTADDREQVREWANIGLANVLIAHRLRIDRKTLARHFQAELDLGRAEAMAEVLEALKDGVEVGSVPAIKLWLLLRREAAEMDNRAEPDA